MKDYDEPILVLPGNFYVLYEENPSRWQRPLLTDDNLNYEGLELLKTDSLEVKGKIDSEDIKPGKKYIASFLIKMKEDANFETPATFTLVLPDGTVNEWSVDLDAQPPNKWVRVRTGEFVGPSKQGDINFSLTNFDQNWKSGLVLGGVYVEPSF